MFKFLKSLFKKKVQVYTAFGNEDYFRIAGKLSNQGIRHETRSPSIVRATHNDFHVDMYQYDIYVNAEDEHKALKAIHSSS